MEDKNKLIWFWKKYTLRKKNHSADALLSIKNGDCFLNQLQNKKSKHTLNQENIVRLEKEIPEGSIIDSSENDGIPSITATCHSVDEDKQKNL